MNVLQAWIVKRGWWHAKRVQIYSDGGDAGVIEVFDGADTQYFRYEAVSVTEQIFRLVEKLHCYWLKRYMVQELAERRRALNQWRTRSSDADKAAE